MKILICEDDPSSRRLLERTLSRRGYDIIEAEDGQKGWDLYQATPDAHLIITDWMMPITDGIELCKRIREHPRQTYTYIIILTALDGKEKFLEGMEAGADDFMNKPFDKDTLDARLRVADRILSLHKHVSQLEGLLPICSYCKSIRDDDEIWQPMENFISERSEANFSHGICPSCYQKHIAPQVEG